MLAAIAAASWVLVPFWREAPDLSHGWFAPFAAVLLLWHSRKEAGLGGPADTGRTHTLVQAGVVATGMLFVCLASVAALVMGPLHSQTAFFAVLATSMVLVSGVFVLSASPLPWVRFNGASLAAAFLWICAIPLPSFILAHVSLTLQTLITTISVKVMVTVGIPALQRGNVIHFPNAVVGVEEACSGIRSLTACLFAGTVFGGFMLTGLLRRATVIVGAGILAIAMNLVRSLVLCLLVYNGVNIEGTAHDAIGYIVLSATVLCLFGACRLMTAERQAASPSRTGQPEMGMEKTLNPSRSAAAANARFLPHFALCGLAALLITGVGLRIATVTAAEQQPPDLRKLLAVDQPGWTRRTYEGISTFSRALKTSTLRQETFVRGDIQVTFYVAYWSSIQSTLSTIALHTPDICLPGSGWSACGVPPEVSRYPLPRPRRFAFISGTYPQHVWFWHFFDGRAVSSVSDRNLLQLASAVFRHGVRVRAPQWVIRVSSNRPLETLADEPLLTDFFARVRAAGLAGSANP